MSRRGRPGKKHQQPTAEIDESYSGQTHGRLQPTETQRRGSKLSSEVPLMKSSKDSVPRDPPLAKHNSQLKPVGQEEYQLPETRSEQELAHIYQKPTRPKSFANKKEVTPATPFQDAKEYEDEELSEHFQSAQRPASGPDPTKARTKEAPSIVSKLAGYFYKSRPSSSKSDSEHQTRRQHRGNYAKEYPQHSPARSSRSNRVQGEGSDKVAKLEQELEQKLKEKERIWRAEEGTLLIQIGNMGERMEQMEGELELTKSKLAEAKDRTRLLKAKIRDTEDEKETVQEQHASFVRKQQEESFRQMESARWLPVEESKVIGDLDRLKRDMRAWAKGNSASKNNLIRSLDDEGRVSLMYNLGEVCLLENDKVPEGLHSSRSIPLLLNALLAHGVYMSLFRNPFFFLEDGHGDTLPRPGLDCQLEDIYQRTQKSNQEDAHIWRAQTLRLLLPPLRNNTSTAERDLRRETEERIAKTADNQASIFLKGPARNLIHEKAKDKSGNKIREIYRTAGTLSYMLWTRKTTIKCYSIHEMDHLAFDSESKFLVPHTSVRYDDHEDHLQGRPISMFVHPLLKVYGTDDGKDYDIGRVWAPAEVWLESRE
ncbi:hypothetical protein G7Y89_g4106 [Cudoniella acicularis]|uniref:Uncharacterized protein n=1 Tax=Cudoniella acicularis TaxID=354080 RepID=A0A8H4RQ42_9HELO|nr:hypothetical protein G7Y89_g4106 [Cudoniella acicularis]